MVCLKGKDDNQKVLESGDNRQNAAYLLNIDERTDAIDTVGDGYWGDCQEFYHTHKEKEYLDAVIITVIMPEFENFASMKGRL